MGDRICVTLKSGEEYYPTLYCHWAGLRALTALHEALAESRREKENIPATLSSK